jgi:hypothetical protein
MRLDAPNVIFHNGHPYFMIRVHSDLVEKFNMQYIRKSLKTTIPAEVKLLAINIYQPLQTKYFKKRH